MQRSHSVTRLTGSGIQEGHAFSYRASAGIDTITGQPALLPARAVAVLDGDFAHGLVPATQVQVDDRYRYSQITPLNDAPGLHATLTYTYATSDTKQSQLQLPTTQYGGVSLRAPRWPGGVDLTSGATGGQQQRRTWRRAG